MSSAVVRRGIVALVASGGLVVAPLAAPTAFGADSGRAEGVERIAGADRYETSAEISRRSFDSGVGTAFIASGEIFTDALSGAPVAAQRKGPLLLVKAGEIPSAIAAELTRLRPRRIVVLGGPATISTSVESQLGSYTSGGVDRWMGKDRYEASAQISQETFDPGVSKVYLASGEVFPDALSGAPVAGMDGAPMLLTADDRLPSAIAEELDRLNPKTIYVLGGPNSVSDEVSAGLTDYTDGFVERLWGADRYDASANIAKESFAPGVSVAYVAYGQVFSDALSGAPVGGIRRGPMLLVDDTDIPDSIREALGYLQPKKIVVLGGTASVSTAVEEELAGYVSP